ncbi:esterase B1-like isoform X2 [Contarinia nasturtii]|uniref:esterase B1-like isoform X2 n=1 Tax=Contarinia nasturtii TaxID=265458 RepID=UPI0012D3ABF5|nr:esterase B1-like isoform X2 [Contarinia nasturtii]
MSRNCGGMIMLAVIVFVVCLINSGESVEYKIVKTKNGAVRGISDTTMMKNVSFYSFKGIPYAKAPIGELRFKAPEPDKSWAPAILNATAHGKNCLRTTAFDNDTQSQSENCLFLNIYVPADVQPGEKLAVLVFIHGGSFLAGSGDDDFYGPDFIVEKRTILVTLNYRLGIFGFITFNAPEYSGNMALKDQQLALKWTHENIERFSGDPNRITLFGQSAGGVLANFQILSKESRKYFRNAIVMSGTTDNMWAISDSNKLFDFAHKIARETGNPQETIDGLIKFFKQAPAEKIVNYLNDPSYVRRNPLTIYAPIIEKPDAVRPFITKYPEEIYDECNINTDVIFSLCSLEFVTSYASETLISLEELDRNFSLPLPFREAIDLSYDSPVSANQINQNAAVNEQTLKQYLELFSDVYYGYGIDKSAKLHAAKSSADAFLYQFSVKSILNLSTRINPNANLTVYGAGHGDDLCYIFGCRQYRSFYNEVFSTPNDEQSKVSLKTFEDMSTLFTNFAKYGKPIRNGKPIKGFKPIRKNRVNFLDFTNDGLALGVNPNKKAIEFWTYIGQELNEIVT